MMLFIRVCAYAWCLEHILAACTNTPEICRCALSTLRSDGKTEQVPIDAAWRHECNRCVILGVSAGCAAETAWELESFRIGFWAPRDARISQSTVGVVKILFPASDVKNQHLTVRGFNTPTLQGCGRSAYPVNEIGVALWASNTARWAWDSDSTYDATRTICASDDQIWFFNLNVYASQKETAPSSPATLYFEISVNGDIYLTRTTAFLQQQLVDANVPTSITRGLYPITAKGDRPLALDLVPKLFSVTCGDELRLDTHAHNVQLPFEGAWSLLPTTIPAFNYCTISSLDKLLELEISSSCKASSAEIYIPAYSSFKLISPASAINGAVCTFSVKKYCDVGSSSSPGSTVPCAECEAGKFKNTMGPGLCQNCGAGTFMKFTGASVCDVCVNSIAIGSKTCATCGVHAANILNANPPNCACNSGFSFQKTQCVGCVAGKYKTAIANAVCDNCAMGTYSTSVHATSVSQCVACPSASGHTSALGTDSVLNCLCKPGHQSDSNNNCQICESRFYKATTSNTDKCVFCEAGKFSPLPGLSACQTCDTGSFSAAGETRCRFCAINSGIFGTSTVCECDEGYTRLLTTSLFACTICAPGTFKNAVGNAPCTECQQGKFSDKEGRVNDVCMVCPSDTHPNRVSAAFSCLSCPDHSVSPTGSRDVTDCVCKVGFTGQPGLCEQCAAGLIKPLSGSQPCEECEVGKVADTSSQTCVFCSTNTYPSPATRSTFCEMCPNFAVADYGSRDRSACKCRAGYTSDTIGNCAACEAGKYTETIGAAACALCPLMTFGNQIAAPNRSSCSQCADNTVSTEDRRSCQCASAYQYDLITLRCTECSAALRQFKADVGNHACGTCEDEQIFSSSTQTCTDPATIEQTVKLFHGINYVAFHVFDKIPSGTRITDIFQRNHNSQTVFWKTATLNTESPLQQHVLNTNARPNRDFSRDNIVHHSRNVYMINIEFYDSKQFVECSYRGVPLAKFTTMNLRLGSNNFVPILYSSVDDNTRVLPIQMPVHCHSTSSVSCFRYVMYDEFSWIFRHKDTGVLIMDTTSVNAFGTWTSHFSFTPGQFVQLTLRGDPNRPTGQEHIYVQIDNTTLADTSRSSSYDVASAPRTRRLLAMPPSTLDAYCPTEMSSTAQCACRSNSNAILSWPLRDCNQCVLTKSQSCSAMGQQLTLARVKYTIAVVAPAGIELTTNSIAVAKLKRSFEYSTLTPLPAKRGVQYEHLSIRAQSASQCACEDTSGVAANCFSSACVPTTKQWRFELSLAVMESEVSRPADADALVVNFEFDVDGVRYVTQSTELLRPETQMINGAAVEISHLFPSKTKIYALATKRFQIVCPRHMTVVDTTDGTTCPFEGNIVASINIDTSKRRTAPSYLVSAVLDATDVRIRASSFGAAPANTQHFKYTIQRERGQPALYVTLERAQFETCMFAGVYKTINGLSCANALVADMPVCIPPFLTPPVQQTDTLHITKVRSDRTILQTAAWNKDSELPTHGRYATFKLSSVDDTLEIDLKLDSSECRSMATIINISIATTAPVAPDRLDGLNSSVPTCRTAQSCACRLHGSAINWPLDECNACVISNMNDAVCDGMSLSFVNSIGTINYNIFVGNQIVDADSVAVGKLKHSKPFIVQGRSHHYNHLSIRSYVSPTGVGCFNTDDRTSLANAQWSVASFQNCPNSRRKIFFFALPIKASESEIIEPPGTALQISFELSIGDTLYVTRTQKELRSFSGVSSGVAYSTTIHDAVALSETPPRYPQSIDVVPKQFQVTCSHAQPFLCPFEGDELTFLSLNSGFANESIASYTFLLRTMPNKQLHVKLHAFTFMRRDKPGVVRAPCADSTHSTYASSMANGLCEGLLQFSIPPTPSADKLQVFHYAAGLSRHETVYHPNNMLQAGRKWKLNSTGDLLEIIFTTDGIYGDQTDFAFNLTISTAVIFEAPCVPGTSGPDGGLCVPCEIGTYNPSAGSDCQNCPAFSNTLSASSTTLSSCVCQPGYGKTAATSSQFTCTRCIAGTFRGATTCESCPANSNSAEESNDITDCLCNDKYIRNDSLTPFLCQACAAGEYYTRDGTARKCASCPQFSLSSPASASLNSCKCQAGYMQKPAPNDSFVCDPCLAGQYYVPGADALGNCLPCPPFSSSLPTSSGGITACHCDSPYAKTLLPSASVGDFECNRCTNGTYRAAVHNQSAVCTECPAFSTSPNSSISIDQCTCDADLVRVGGNNSPLFCVSSTQMDCEPGYSNVNTGTCMPCEAGTSKQARGSATICTPCTANSQSDSGSAVCRCNAGHTGIADTCRACPVNTYKAAAGDQMCELCAPNHVSPAGSLNATACVCGAGAGGNMCVACESGTFKDALGNSACELCGANMVSSVASTSRNNCLCARGYGGAMCAPCAANTYKDELGPNGCVNCVQNSLSPPASTRQTDCRCVAAEGWQATSTLPQRCERVLIVTQKKYEVPFELSTFIADLNNVRSDFKQTLAVAHESRVANIALIYYATGTTAPVYTGRRRRRNLLQIAGQTIASIQAGSCTVEASINSFASIPLPADNIVLARLRIIYPNLLQYSDATALVPSQSGFSLFGLNILWLAVIGGSLVVCLCVIFVIACSCGRRDRYEFSDRDSDDRTPNRRSDTYQPVNRERDRRNSPPRHSSYRREYNHDAPHKHSQNTHRDENRPSRYEREGR